ncbi:MAG: hypothetical protein H8E76_02670 [Helicobacteraceae bacterium]|nr:hypothetical protein [Candidatus Sulfurimonas ponti]
MSATNKEMQLQRNCQLYAYVLVSQGKEVPEYIEESAESYDYLVDCVVELSEEIKGLDSDTFERVVNNTQSQEARELAYWWRMYQEANELSNSLTQTCL